MEFRCPSCKELTENEFVTRIYDEMKYQCLSCRKEWKIIFVESKSDPVPNKLWHSKILEDVFSGAAYSDGFKFSTHEVYGDNKRTFCRRCGLSVLNSEMFNNTLFTDNPCVWPNDYDKENS